MPSGSWGWNIWFIVVFILIYGGKNFILYGCLYSCIGEIFSLLYIVVHDIGKPGFMAACCGILYHCLDHVIGVLFGVGLSYLLLVELPVYFRLKRSLCEWVLGLPAMDIFWNFSLCVLLNFIPFVSSYLLVLSNSMYMFFEALCFKFEFFFNLCRKFFVFPSLLCKSTDSTYALSVIVFALSFHAFVLSVVAFVLSLGVYALSFV